jgi:phospholipase C
MTGLESIDHVILLMLENRWFDQLLGYLYPRSDDFHGLDGTESNRDAAGYAVSVFPITPEHQNTYYYPLPNPAEGFTATNEQLFSSATAPDGGTAANDGGRYAVSWRHVKGSRLRGRSACAGVSGQQCRACGCHG